MNQMLPRIILWTSLSASVAFVTLVACFMINLALPNYGWEIGYYGQFNRIKHVIEEMPEVDVVDHWQHQDISLEDFGFTLQLANGEQVQINFMDNTEPKNERNRKRIRTYIEKEIALALKGKQTS